MIVPLEDLKRFLHVWGKFDPDFDMNYRSVHRLVRSCSYGGRLIFQDGKECLDLSCENLYAGVSSFYLFWLKCEEMGYIK